MMHHKMTAALFIGMITSACSPVVLPETVIAPGKIAGSPNQTGTPVTQQNKSVNPGTSPNPSTNSGATKGADANGGRPTNLPNPANGQGAIPQGAAAGKHLADVGVKSIFLASCKSKLSAPGVGTVVQDTGSLSADGRAAQSVWTKLVKEGSVKHCQEVFVSIAIENQEKESLVQSIRDVCRGAGDSFSEEVSCEPPETGFQNLLMSANVTGLSAGDPRQVKPYSSYFRSTQSASGVSSADKDVLKKGAAEIFRSPIGKNFLTTDLQ